MASDINETSRTVTLRAHRKMVCKAVTVGSLLSFNSLSPGMLVNAIVDEKTAVSGTAAACSLPLLTCTR